MEKHWAHMTQDVNRQKTHTHTQKTHTQQNTTLLHTIIIKHCKLMLPRVSECPILLNQPIRSPNTSHNMKY